MNHTSATCKHCGNSKVYFQLPGNFFYKVIGLKIYWCDHCDGSTYVWPITSRDHLDWPVKKKAV